MSVQVPNPLAPQNYLPNPFHWKPRNGGNTQVDLTTAAVQLIAENADGSLKGLIVDTYWHGGLETKHASARSPGMIYEPQTVYVNLEKLPPGTTTITLHVYNLHAQDHQQTRKQITVQDAQHQRLYNTHTQRVRLAYVQTASDNLSLSVSEDERVFVDVETGQLLSIKRTDTLFEGAE
jgi:hypothetical protein